MAITYNLNVNRLGASDSFSIGATITDDTKPVGHQTETVAIWGKLDTPERQQAVWDAINIQYLIKLAESEAMSILELEGKNYLETL